MAAAIRRLLSDEGLRADFGRAGRDRATAHYAMDRVITSTLRAYASTLLPTQRRLRA
jgi:glycosyltransferase involved in cell wall biosynthesis